jgi:hypothetical protein
MCASLLQTRAKDSPLPDHATPESRRMHVMHVAAFFMAHHDALPVLENFVAESWPGVDRRIGMYISWATLILKLAKGLCQGGTRTMVQKHLLK